MDETDVALDAMAPLFVGESPIIPTHLNGSQGENRTNKPCRIAAGNDWEAIQSWLASKGDNPKTYQAYQKELGRFILWAVIERNKAFSSLNTDDCQAYMTFLKQLQSSNTFWVQIIPSHKSRGQWKPFQYHNRKKVPDGKVLSSRSINYAKVVITSCMDWLVQQQYLEYNSFAAIASLKASASQVSQRAFTQQHIQAMMAFAQSLVCPGTPNYVYHLRVWFVLRFAFHTGLRLNELAQATYGDIECLDDGDGKHYFLRVVGKNSKLRKASLPSVFIEALQDYRQALGSPANFELVDPIEPLINSLRKKIGQQHLTTAALHKVFSGFFQRWQTHLQSEGTDPRLLAKVQQASAHWLRHSYGSFLANECQVPLSYIRDELGHASIATTSIYLNADEKKRRQAVDAAFTGKPVS